MQQEIDIALGNEVLYRLLLYSIDFEINQLNQEFDMKLVILSRANAVLGAVASVLTPVSRVPASATVTIFVSSTTAHTGAVSHA